MMFTFTVQLWAVLATAFAALSLAPFVYAIFSRRSTGDGLTILFLGAICWPAAIVVALWALSLGSCK